MTESREPKPSELILRMTMGMWVAQMVGVTAKLGVADQIAAGLTDSDAIADAVGANRDALYRLLRGVAAAGVLRQTGARQFALSPVGEALRDVPGSMRDFIIAETAPGHWLPWGRLEDAVRTGTPQTHATLGSDAWTYYEQHPDEAASFSRAMGGMSAMAGGAVLAKVDVTPYQHVVDVGGAYGDWLVQFLAGRPQARGTLFDLPHVVEGARAALAAKGLGDRVDVVGGSFFDGVPAGGDLYLLKHILHDWSDAECVTILERVRQAMGPAGTLLVAEFVILEDGQPSPAPLLDVNMLVMLTGRERTQAEYAALMAKAGLKLDRLVKTESPVSALIAVPA